LGLGFLADLMRGFDESGWRLFVAH
jgi:hypothetical protein